MQAIPHRVLIALLARTKLPRVNHCVLYALQESMAHLQDRLVKAQHAQVLVQLALLPLQEAMQLMIVKRVLPARTLLEVQTAYL